MTIRRRLVETPSGFVHVRSAGAGPPILLLHWTPASSRLYIPALEELGTRDTPATPRTTWDTASRTRAPLPGG